MHGTKLTYECAVDKWNRAPVTLRISEEPFAEGGMRFAFRAREILEDGSELETVVKCFKEEVLQPDEDERELIMDEAMTQMVADDYAQQFTRLAASKGLSHCLAFLPVSVVMLDDGTTYSMEPYLPGEYIKFNDNDGHVEREDEAASAFSYFTYHTSGGAMLICDLQGVGMKLTHCMHWPICMHSWIRALCVAQVGTFYTDPQIHTLDGSGFGAGNMGEEGIRRFLRSHRHTLLCEQLDLASPDAGLTDEELAAKLQADEHRMAAEEEEEEDPYTAAESVAEAAEAAMSALSVGSSSNRGWDSSRYESGRSQLARHLARDRAHDPFP